MNFLYVLFFLCKPARPPFTMRSIGLKQAGGKNGPPPRLLLPARIRIDFCQWSLLERPIEWAIIPSP